MLYFGDDSCCSSCGNVRQQDGQDALYKNLLAQSDTIRLEFLQLLKLSSKIG